MVEPPGVSSKFNESKHGDQSASVYAATQGIRVMDAYGVDLFVRTSYVIRGALSNRKLLYRSSSSVSIEKKTQEGEARTSDLPSTGIVQTPS